MQCEISTNLSEDKTMQKETITLQGVDYVVRTLDVRSLPSFEGEGYAEMTVADYALWDAVEEAIKAGDYDACKIDDEIFFYLESDFINADPTDEQILGYLREHLCGVVPYAPVTEPEALDFYAIELDDLGQKQISLLGYTYKGDNWKCIDVRGVCLPLSEFVDGMREHEDYVQSLYEGSKEYERDVTDEECVKAMNGFYAGKPADYRLRFSDVCMETPVGNYVHLS